MLLNEEEDYAVQLDKELVDHCEQLTIFMHRFPLSVSALVSSFNSVELEQPDYLRFFA